MKFKDTELYYFFHRLKFKIEMVWYDFKCRCQRFMRGYSYSDVWGMDYWFIETVKPMLTHLRDHGCGVPGILCNEEDCKAKWDAILTEMIECLDMMNEDNVYEKLFGKDWFEEIKTLEEWRQVNEIMDQNKTRFFELFSEYFYCLWD